MPDAKLNPHIVVASYRKTHQNAERNPASQYHAPLLVRSRVEQRLDREVQGISLS
jgi:hypothetical protein